MIDLILQAIYDGGAYVLIGLFALMLDILTDDQKEISA